MFLNNNSNIRKIFSLFQKFYQNKSKENIKIYIVILNIFMKKIKHSSFY